MSRRAPSSAPSARSARGSKASAPSPLRAHRGPGRSGSSSSSSSHRSSASPSSAASPASPPPSPASPSTPSFPSPAELLACSLAMTSRAEATRESQTSCRVPKALSTAARTCRAAPTPRLAPSRPRAVLPWPAGCDAAGVLAMGDCWPLSPGDAAVRERFSGGGVAPPGPGRSCARTAASAPDPSKFLQSLHLQFSEQKMPAWKHSQYFLRHPDLRQLQPLLCLAPSPPSGVPAILGRNA